MRRKKTANYKRMMALIISIIFISGVIVFALDDGDSPYIRDNDSGGYASDYITTVPQDYNEYSYAAPPSYYYEDEGEYGYAPQLPYYHGQEHSDSQDYSYATGPTYDYEFEECDGYDCCDEYGHTFMSSRLDFLRHGMQHNDCECPRACFCHVEGWYETLSEASSFIGIAPTGFVPYGTVTVTHPNQIQGYVDAMSENGYRTILLNFPGNTISTNNVPTILIQGNRRIILDSANSNNQVWYRDQTGGRHFMLGRAFVYDDLDNVGSLELRNVTLSRSASFRVLYSTSGSGGVGVQGATLTGIRSHLILNHPNATISYNRTNAVGSTAEGVHGGGGIGVAYGAMVTIEDGNIINNFNTGHGGGIFANALNSIHPAFRVVITIENGRISGNTALRGGGGIGMCCNVEVVLKNGAIYNNTASGVGTHFTQGGGGGVHLGIWEHSTTNRLYMHGGSIGHSNPALGNEASASGGGVLAPANDRVFYMFSGAIYHNRAWGDNPVQGGGGVYPAAYGTFVFNGGVIGGRWQGGNLVPAPNWAERGGGVMLPAGVRLEMRGTPETTIIMSNHAYQHGGGIYVTGETEDNIPSIIMEGGTIGGTATGHGNTAGISGGGMYVGPNADFTMRPGVVDVGGNNVDTVGNIIGNYAPIGGGINTVGGLTLEAGNIRHNIASDAANASAGLGGGIHVSDTTAILNFEGSGTINIENNFARLGGGVYWLDGELNVALNTGPINIRNNNATDGAGVWIGGDGPMPITANMNVYNNTAAGNGGGVFVAPTGHLVMNSTTARVGHSSPLLGNTATRGGGVYLQGTLTMQAGNILGNTATVNGGGVYMGAAGALFDMQSAGAKVISGNTAVYGGGVHWGQGAWNVSSGAAISGNSASANGGGIWVTSSAPISLGNLIEINGNTAINGGGIMVDGNTSLTLTGVFHIFDNTATQSGGGVFVDNGSTLVMGSPTVTIGHATPALGNSALRGGGVHLEGAMNMQAGSIIGNSATGTAVTAGIGGGIYFGTPTATLTMSGAANKNINGNSATRHGGGVHWSQGTWNVAGNTGNISISNNSALSQGGQGGGIHMSGGRVLTICNRWMISGNQSTGWGPSSGGGGVWMGGTNTVLTVNGGVITQNDAICSSGFSNGGLGGGVHVFGGAVLNMIDGEISHNTASAMGGGVMAQRDLAAAGVAFTMEGGSINNNSSENGGGGITIGVSGSNDTYGIMTGGEIICNVSSHGGGVWLMHGILTVYEGSISDNTAGIGAGSHPSNRHGGGGGVMVCCTSRLYLHEDGQINGNTGRVGGGVYLSHSASSMPGILSYFTMLGGEVNDNTAIVSRFMDSNNNPYGPADLEFDGDGGGIFITSTGYLIFEGSDPKSVSGNTAENSGGGVRWVTGYWYTSDNTSTVEFVGNEAAEDGGGIYIGGGMFTIVGGTPTFIPGSLTTHGTWTINDNDATRGGGVFVGGGYFLDAGNNPVHFSSTFVLAYGGVVANNYASLDGGGIFLYDGVNFNMIHGTTIHSNDADRNGGGVFVSSYAEFTMVGGVIGGGRSFITNPDISNATTISAQANTAQRGAGVYLSSGATFTMAPGTAVISGTPTATRGYIRGNHATLGGGGVAVIDSDDDDVIFTLQAGIIEGNLTTGLGSGIQPSIVSGGGVLVAGENASFNMTGGIIDDNASLQWSGGGVTVMGEADFLMTGGVITDNTSRTAGGGGVAVRHNATFTMEDGTISGNAGIIGGGVLTYNRGTFVLEYGLITNNIVRGGTGGNPGGNLGGGGLAVVSESNAIMRGGTITEHTLRTNLDDGGGVWAGEVLTSVFSGHHFEGVSTFTMEGGYIIDNSARRGGGVFGYGSDGTGSGFPVPIYGNLLDGGDINIAPHNLEYSPWFQNLIDVAMARYTGITPLSSDRSRFIMEGGSIEDNTAATNGGGVHAANGFLIFLDDDALIIDNTATHDGGGIWIGKIEAIFSSPATSVLEMSDGAITENTAGRRGGGIFIGYAEAEITGGEISDNTATNTGGAYVANTGPFYGSGGGIYVTEDGLLSTEDVEIIGNHANQMGGGIFTELHQYAVVNLTDLLAYSNLTIANSTFFDDNTAGQGAFTPPANAFAWTGIPGVAQGIDVSIHNHPINNYDINWRRGAGVPLRLHKGNQYLIGNTSFTAIGQIAPYLLEGAYFTLFRFIGTGPVPDHAYVGSPVWEVVVANARSTGNILTPIVMNLTPEATYHLVELLAPAGYMIPMGQWRITVTPAVPGGFTITSIGTLIPDLVHLGGYFYVGNRIDFYLPLAGGRGAELYMHSGIGFLVLAMVISMAYIIHAKRERI